MIVILLTCVRHKINNGVVHMKKKFLMGLLSSTLLLTACGNSEDTPEDNNATEDPTEDVTDEDTGAEETNDSIEETEETDGATIKTLYTAPHGDKAFAATFVVMDGDTIAEVIIDEYQFMDSEEVIGVPNSEAKFGDGSVEDVTLISKLENDKFYSENMGKAGSTVSYSDNLTAIEDFAKGKTITEIEETINEL